VKASRTSGNSSVSRPAQDRRRSSESVCRPLQILPGPEEIAAQPKIETERPAKAVATGTSNHPDGSSTPTRQVDPAIFATLWPSQKAIPPNLLARFLNRRTSAPSTTHARRRSCGYQRCAGHRSIARSCWVVEVQLRSNWTGFDSLRLISVPGIPTGKATSTNLVTRFLHPRKSVPNTTHSRRTGCLRRSSNLSKC
jgi:hypothetical protein